MTRSKNETDVFYYSGIICVLIFKRSEINITIITGIHLLSFYCTHRLKCVFAYDNKVAEIIKVNYVLCVFSRHRYCCITKGPWNTRNVCKF